MISNKQAIATQSGQTANQRQTQKSINAKKPAGLKPNKSTQNSICYGSKNNLEKKHTQ